MKRRDSKDLEIVPKDDIVNRLRELIKTMHDEIDAKVVEMTFK